MYCIQHPHLPVYFSFTRGRWLPDILATGRLIRNSTGRWGTGFKTNLVSCQKDEDLRQSSNNIQNQTMTSSMKCMEKNSWTITSLRTPSWSSKANPSRRLPYKMTLEIVLHRPKRVTLCKTNKEKFVFQLSIFKGELLVLGRLINSKHSWQDLQNWFLLLPFLPWFPPEPPLFPVSKWFFPARK